MGSLPTQIKDPDATARFGVNWSSHLASGDTIATSQWIVSPAGVTSSGAQQTTTTTSVLLSGGSLGAQHEITNRITTAQGETLDMSFSLVLASL